MFYDDRIQKQILVFVVSTHPWILSTKQVVLKKCLSVCPCSSLHPIEPIHTINYVFLVNINTICTINLRGPDLEL